MTASLRLRDVRAIFRLIGDIRAVGADPARWRTHLVRRLRRTLGAAIVVSSEVHVRRVPDRKDGKVRVIDIGWGCDESDEVWQIQTDTLARPEEFLLALPPDPADAAGPADADVPVRPTTPLRGGSTFVLSQYPLPHLGAIDQLGVHNDSTQAPFTPAQHKLIRLFHVELGRLWTQDALDNAKNPDRQLPPRLAQTLAALQAGCSEKEVSQRLGISKHTVHNYVKALHQRFGVSSRGELLAAVPKPQAAFLPNLSVQ